MLVEKAKAYGTDYQKMIDELGGEKINVENFTMEGRGFGSLGVEEKICGTALGMKEGVYSAPLAGGNAMAVVKVTGSTPATPTDYDAIRKEYVSRFNNAILNGNAYTAIYDNAKIVNNGILFY